jgi:hypothetical protein
MIGICAIASGAIETIAAITADVAINFAFMENIIFLLPKGAGVYEKPDLITWAGVRNGRSKDVRSVLSDMDPRLLETLLPARQALPGQTGFVFIALACDSSRQIEHVKFGAGMAQQMGDLPEPFTVR